MKTYKLLLVGNPNVGKTTVFNTLTGENQHTGNWIGKTVESAKGSYIYKENTYEIYDLPGTYSLNAHSKEEEVSRDCILFDHYDLIVIVVDDCSLERNLNLVLQTLEVTNNVVLAINLIDEAEKKNIFINENKISDKLGIPSVKISAKRKIGIDKLLEQIYLSIDNKTLNLNIIKHNDIINDGILLLKEKLKNYDISDWIYLKLIENDKDIINKLKENNINLDDSIMNLISVINKEITCQENKSIEDIVIEDYSKISSDIGTIAVIKKEDKKEKIRNCIDKILTSKITGIPIMLLLVMLVFYITIVLANYPSSLLFDMFNYLGNELTTILNLLNVPNFIILPLMNGIYKTLTWVVSVMLPPMAIFFPLFSLLEDLGYLPRVAFNMDGAFQKCNSCGKQSLTMMMGFGCNAVGVTGTRIIDSKRERLIAILTNNFIPCNGRFPMIISIITMFLAVGNLKFSKVLILTLFIVISVVMTFIVSKLLSITILKGEGSSFTLELPPFRKPDIIKTIIRSFKDKTIKVLKRAIIVSIPAGLFIWILANIKINNSSVLSYLNTFLDPFGNLMGLDGVILTAFLLAFPANEIVIPIILMTYLSTGEMIEFTSLTALKDLLVSNGWTMITALCTIVFSIFHFPCSTTALTIKKETGSLKWTIFSIIMPTVIGIILCMLINFIMHLI